MGKIFRYECRRLLWNKFFAGLLLVLLFYGWQVLPAGEYLPAAGLLLVLLFYGWQVLTGGELPALVFVDTVGRLCEGVLADESCFTEESHFNGLLEYPQYSRPAVWHGKEVPAVLLSGHHANICRWRREQSLLRTRDKRPDLLEKAVLDAGDLAFLDGEKRIK